MKKIIILLIIVASFCNIYSQVFWNEVTSGVTTALRCVSNIDGFNAWVSGVNGVVLKTTNSGYNWINVSGNGIPSNITLINIYGINSTTALTAGYTGSNTYVYRTSNGGANWTQVFYEASGFIDGVWMTTSTNGFMVGDPVTTRWSLWKTTNGGVNWDSAGLYLVKNGTEAGWNSSLWMKANNIWFGTNNTRIYFSSNYGLNWSVQSTSPELNSYTVTLDSGFQYLGFTGGASGMLKTTNKGLNWVPVTAPGSGNFNGFAIFPMFQSQAWFVRTGTSIYYSVNPFTSWSVQYTAPSGNFNSISVTRTSMTGPGFIYAVRSNGGISRANLFVEGVSIISNEIPSDYKLYQNYPNPFNPSTKIRFNLPKLKISNPGEVRGALVRIKIYNSLGKEVESLVDQITQPGIYEDSWDAAAFPSGVYYYQLSVIDPKYSTLVFSQTKKMVLVK